MFFDEILNAKWSFGALFLMTGIYILSQDKAKKNNIQNPELNGTDRNFNHEKIE